MATHSTILAWKNLMDRGAWQATVYGVTKEPDTTQQLNNKTYVLGALENCCWVTEYCLNLCDPMDCSTTGFPVLHNLPEFVQIHVQWVYDATQPSHPLSPPSPLPSIFLSIRIFSNISAFCIRCPKYWSFSFSISPSNEYLGLISFRIDCFGLLVVQGTLKSLLQHHSSKASILQHSAFFILQSSHPYMTPGKTIALTIQSFVSKVISLLFNTLSRTRLKRISSSSSRRFVIVFLSRINQTVKRLLAMRETQVLSLGREDPLEKEMATHSSTLA